MFSARVRNRQTMVFTEPTMTKQAPAREVDINYIVNRYLKTGQMDMPESAHQFGYVPAIDLQEALQLVMDAEEHFGSLPAHVRAAFENDPVKLLSAMENPANRDWLVDLGLVEPKDVEVPPSPSDRREKVPVKPVDVPAPKEGGEEV